MAQPTTSESQQPAARRRRQALVATARDIEQRTPRQADSLGYSHRALVQANFPYRQVEAHTFTRRAGNLRLHLEAPPHIGLPYGRYPRLLLAWVSSEAVKAQRPRVELGPSLSAFLRELGVTAAGGAHGPIRRVRDQMKRLFSTTISVTWEEPDQFSVEGFRFTRSAYLWWDAARNGQAVETGSHVTLSGDFYDALVARPVPLDLRILRALTSPLALDVYCWLSYRTHKLRHRAYIPWSRLHQQFGTQSRYPADFRRSFRQALAKVLTLQPHHRVRPESRHLVLQPNAPAASPPPSAGT